jgi:hypothetical protein
LILEKSRRKGTRILDRPQQITYANTKAMREMRENARECAGTNSNTPAFLQAAGQAPPREEKAHPAVGKLLHMILDLVYWQLGAFSWVDKER